MAAPIAVSSTGGRRANVKIHFNNAIGGALDVEISRTEAISLRQLLEHHLRNDPVIDPDVEDLETIRETIDGLLAEVVRLRDRIMQTESKAENLDGRITNLASRVNNGARALAPRQVATPLRGDMEPF
jgi:hypothetical protein